MTITLLVVAMCRAKGIRLIAYLDDVLALARNWRQLISHTSIVLDILDQAGFQRNLKKCHMQPRQNNDATLLEKSDTNSDLKRSLMSISSV